MRPILVRRSRGKPDLERISTLIREIDRTLKEKAAAPSTRIM